MCVANATAHTLEMVRMVVEDENEPGIWRLSEDTHQAMFGEMFPPLQMEHGHRGCAE